MTETTAKRADAIFIRDIVVIYIPPGGIYTVTEPSNRCPRCGETGAAVDPITLKALLSPDGLRRGVPPAPRFCATESCPVVYFDRHAAVTFAEADLTVRVYAKHPADEDVPVCYCFDISPRSLTVTPAETREMVTREVKAGHCACEVRNPKGTCCLGDLRRLEEEAWHLEKQSVCALKSI